MDWEEESLLLLKPDAQARELSDIILERVMDAGLVVIQPYIITPSEEMVRTHYEKSILKYGGDIAERLVRYMTSGPIVVARVGGETAVESLRSLCGTAGDPAKCAPGSIRFDLADDCYERSTPQGRAVRNLVHSSDSLPEAKHEIGLWYVRFMPKELVRYSLAA